ncbi:LANO_0E10616g1_1 [Lachancea nothofagi CBS 11611]|uniref:LANO_0E10616g1_1 n=1 Tax=Lachancea nothofagi CBS 11611 TaxID=1266666 RepID=A0A1G4JWV2_9SACH|nr:LANO_0E10616g1_1 [Lachancea nothofagi CBS 11611]
MSEPKSKRNSFFFFSSGSKSSGPKLEANVSSVKHVGKYPLRKSVNAQSERVTSEFRSPPSPAPAPAPASAPAATSPVIQPRTSPDSSSTFKETTPSSKLGPSKPSRARRPPPPEFLADLHISSPTKVEDSVEGLNKAKVSTEAAGKGHSRKKSEIDELMEHLDHFGDEGQQTLGDDTSVGRSSSSEHFQTPSLDLPVEDTDADTNSFFVKSLNLSKSKLSLSSREANDSFKYPSSPQLKAANQPNDRDDDRFSFADSQVESVQDLQQVSFNGNSQHNLLEEQSFAEEAMTDDLAYDDDQSLLEKPRQFRVVNEHRPNFTMNDESSTTDNESISFKTESHVLPVQDAMLTPQPPFLSGPPITSESDLFQVDTTPRRNISSSSSTPALGGNLSPKSGTDSEFTVRQPFDDPPTIFKSHSPHRSGTDKSVRLVSSYVEELRLKYFPTSNSLQPPPDLPFILKTKNNLEQPQNIKVRIRTSSKQIGIKHGKAKQKLLSLETAKEEDEDADKSGMLRAKGNPVSTQVDHTREFHDLLNKSSTGVNMLAGKDHDVNDEHDDERQEDEDELYLRNIPGDEAYDSDDVMAPLRERNVAGSVLQFAENAASGTYPSQGAKSRINRSDTVTSYFTRKTNNRARSGTLDVDYRYKADKSAFSQPQKEHSYTEDSSDDGISVQTSNSAYYQSTFNGGLRVTNEDPVSE